MNEIQDIINNEIINAPTHEAILFIMCILFILMMCLTFMIYPIFKIINGMIILIKKFKNLKK